jgi:Tfp pilus assembly protein PilP
MNQPAAGLTQPAAISPLPGQPTHSIRVTGVVQIGSNLNAIVEDAQQGGSRYVQAGDYLDNGRVLVKQIEIQPNREPRVILIQDGIEMIKTVGGAG